ncbi:hypothetical protein QUF75_01065 [Desulfococcaceae bacterium HSG7]|nr:hypothetical protein [Desulfococcaceae bacterium HSG7]
MQRQTEKKNVFKFFYQSTLFQKYENQVARYADRCFTPHYTLRNKLKRVNRNVDMLFHAHNYAILPALQSSHNNQIHVGFAGFIHYRLLDKWLLAALKQEDIILHLIGPLQNYDLTPFNKFSNFKYTSPLKEEQLIEKLLEMDVLIIPLNTDLPEVEVITTNSKTFQYIAARKPIVISNFPHYIDMPKGVIYRAATADDFVVKIRKAYTEDCKKYVNMRAQIAQENTWDKRGDQLLGVMRKDVPSIKSFKIS